MNIEISPADIDGYIKEAIIKSALGNEMSKQIDKCVDELITGYNSVVKKFAAQAIADIVQAYMDKPEIRDDVMLRIAQHVTPDVIDRIVQTGVDKIKREIENRY